MHFLTRISFYFGCHLVFNPLLHNLDFQLPWKKCLLKTIWEKMLVTSKKHQWRSARTKWIFKQTIKNNLHTCTRYDLNWNASFNIHFIDFSYHLVFNPLPHNLDFQLPWKRGLFKTMWEMEKMLVTSIFSFFHNVFYPSPYQISMFDSHLFCRLQMLSTSVQNFVVW